MPPPNSRTDLFDGVPLQIPTRFVPEMRHKRIYTEFHNRGADRVLHLVVVVHYGVDPADFYLFDWTPPGTRPEVIGEVDQAR